MTDRSHAVPSHDPGPPASLVKASLARAADRAPPSSLPYHTQSLRCLSFGWNNIDEPSGMLSAVWPPSGSVGPSNLEFLMVPELPLGLAALPAPQRVVQDGRMREELAAVLCGRKEARLLSRRMAPSLPRPPNALLSGAPSVMPSPLSSP